MNFRQVRKKIKTVSNVRQITKAMQMVASVKMRKSQEAASQGQPYREKLERVVKRVLSGSVNINNPYMKKIKSVGSTEKKLYIVISSNKGLCGSFNSSLFKLIFASVEVDNNLFITLGRKGAEFLSRVKGQIIADFSQKTPFIDAVSAVFSQASQAYLAGQCSQVYLIYNSFESTLKYQSTISQLLPIVSVSDVEFKMSGEEDNTATTNYAIEPSEEEVFNALIIDYLEDKIRGAILESDAAENSARMMAMKNATDNARDIMGNLTLLSNKLRQTSITNELLDAISAQLGAQN